MDRLSPLQTRGYVPVGLVGILIFQIYVTAVSGVMAMLKDSRVWMGITCLIFFHILVISTAINYLLCVFLDPGFVPYAWQPSDEMGPVIRARTDAEAVGELLNPRTMIMDQEGTCQARQDNRRYCHECKVSVHRSTYMCHSLLQRSVEREHWKPLRAHHCRTCAKCVLKMDHHCVFINNCVGYQNQKFFILFVTSGLFGCIIGAFAGFHSFVYLFRSQFYNHETESDITLLGSKLVPNSYLGVLIIVGWITSCGMALTLSVFSSFHTYLLLTNQTTIETWSPSQRAKYSVGLLHNIRSVMGSNPLLWLLPVPSSIPTIDDAGYEQLERDNR